MRYGGMDGGGMISGMSILTPMLAVIVTKTGKKDPEDNSNDYI